MSEHKKNDPAAMQTAHQWLKEAAGCQGVDFEKIKPHIKELLDLTRAVAHGPSRPAAPLTAFLVGLATPPDNVDSADISRRISQLSTMADNWSASDEQA